jgi:hypothetical protein
MIPIEILVMTSGALGAVAIVVAAHPDRRRFGLRLPRVPGMNSGENSSADAREAIRPGTIRR